MFLFEKMDNVSLFYRSLDLILMRILWMKLTLLCKPNLKLCYCLERS